MKPRLYNTVTTYVVRKEDGDWGAPRVARSALKAFSADNAKQRARLAVRLRLRHAGTATDNEDVYISMISVTAVEDAVMAGV